MSGLIDIFRRMMWLVVAIFGLLIGASVGLAQDGMRSVRAPDVRVDFERGGTAEPLIVELDRDAFHLSVSAWFDHSAQTLSLTGTLRSKVNLEPQARLSYQIYDEAGELLHWDGSRFDWESSATTDRTARFDLELPLLETQPWRRRLRIQFNAVVEGQYWFNETHPDIEFPLVELANLPLRDHYRPLWSWIPRFLPAQTRCLIPVSWDVVNRDEKASGFVASMDIEGPSDGERVEATRVTFGGASSQHGHVRLWLPLGPLVSGAMEARPGIVWEDVRWYRAEDWFAYQRVRVVPPLVYVAAAILVAGILTGWWAWVGRWRGWGMRFGGRLAALFGWVWLAAQLVISGYWIVIAILGAVVVAVRIPWKLAGTRAYVVAWLLLSFIEIYWGRLSGVAPVWQSATALAIAGWALLLLPLLWVRPAWLRRTIVVSVVMAWLLVSTASVIYYQFFQDFPSVENLLYAGQLGELGESIRSLVEQRHLIPFLVTAVALAISERPTLKTRSILPNTKPLR